MSDFLICGTVNAIPGSQRRSCRDCSTAVFVAPSGQRTVRDKRLAVICVECGLRRIERDPRPEVAPVEAEQIVELLNAMGHRK